LSTLPPGTVDPRAVADRYFSPREVEALIPVLTELMEDVMRAQAGAAEAGDWLRSEQQRVAMAGGAVLDREAWQQAKGRLDVERQRLERGIAEVTTLGGVIKDLGMGLVDFPHQREGRVVNLCWKYGEKDIRYWHGLDEGYAARKPL
jgi:hypothetical protein